MKSRNILILALIMALVTTVLFNNYLKQLDKKYKKNENKISVLVAKQFIGKNEKITKDMLQLKEFSSDSVQPEAIKKIEDVEGKYALVDIQEGEALLPFRFTNQFEEEQVITRKIRDGYRAVSVEVNLVESVSNLVQPEDYVDVVFSENTGAEGVRKIVDTQPILENVRVLAVGKRLKEQGSDNKTIKADTKTSNDQNRNEQSVEYAAVTLELKPEDAVKLINSDERGDIKLILRSSIFPKD